MTTNICKICSKEFRVKPYRKETALYCGYKCLGISKRLEYKSCDFCGEMFKPSLSKNRFCSISCSTKRQFEVGILRRREEGDKRNQPSGYIEVWIEGRWIGEHRLKMERKLGRKLLNTEHVHHKNGIRNDNRIKNLVVLTNSAHNSLEKPKQVPRWNRNNKGQWVKKP